MTVSDIPRMPLCDVLTITRDTGSLDQKMTCYSLILPTTFLARANAEEKASTRDVNIQKGFSIQLQPEWEIRR